MDSQKKSIDVAPLIKWASRVLAHLPKEKRDEVVEEIDEIIGELGRLKKELQLIHSRQKFDDLLAADSKKLRQLANNAVKLRFLEWIKSHAEQRIEIEKDRAAMEKLDESFSQLDSAMEDLHSFANENNKLAKKLGQEPVVSFVPPPVPTDNDSNSASEAMKLVSTSYHKSRRRLINPWKLLWSAYSFEFQRRRRLFGRWAVAIGAGMAIFLLAGLAHNLHSHIWGIAFIMVPLAVAASEMFAHRRIEAWIEGWERQDLQTLLHLLTKARIEVAVDTARADWAIQIGNSGMLPTNDQADTKSPTSSGR